MIRTLWPWLLGWGVVAALFLFYWSRLPRPRLLLWGGVLQRRSPKLGHFVAGKTPEQAVENLVADPRFFARTVDV